MSNKVLKKLKKRAVTTNEDPTDYLAVDLTSTLSAAAQQSDLSTKGSKLSVDDSSAKSLINDDSSLKSQNQIDVGISSAKRVKHDPNGSRSDIIEMILGDHAYNGMISDKDSGICRELLAEETRVEFNSMTGWKTPHTHIALSEQFGMLKSSMETHSTNSRHFHVVAKGVIHHARELEWIKSMQDKELAEYFKPLRAIATHIRGSTNAVFIYLPFLLDQMNEEIYMTAFKSRAALEFMCESLRKYLIEYVPP